MRVRRPSMPKRLWARCHVEDHQAVQGAPAPASPVRRGRGLRVRRSGPRTCTRSGEPGPRPWRSANRRPRGRLASGVEAREAGVATSPSAEVAAERASASGSTPRTRRGCRSRSGATTTPSTTGALGRRPPRRAGDGRAPRARRRARPDLMGGPAHHRLRASREAAARGCRWRGRWPPPPPRRAPLPGPSGPCGAAAARGRAGRCGRRAGHRAVGCGASQPAATSRPSSMVSTRSARAATSRLWVTSSRVLPASRVTRFEQLQHAAPVASSRLPVGSSASTSRGSLDEGAGDGHALLLAAGEPVGKSGVRGRRGPPVRAARGPRAPRRGAARELGGQQHVLEDGQGRDEVEELEHEAHVVAPKERPLARREAVQARRRRPERHPRWAGRCPPRGSGACSCRCRCGRGWPRSRPRRR